MSLDVTLYTDSEVARLEKAIDAFFNNNVQGDKVYYTNPRVPHPISLEIATELGASFLPTACVLMTADKFDTQNSYAKIRKFINFCQNDMETFALFNGETVFT